MASSNKQPGTSLNPALVRSFSERWASWWSELGFWQRWFPLALLTAYWALLIVFDNFKSDNFWMGLLLLSLSFAGAGGRKLLAFVFPLALTGIVYDSQHIYADYIRGRIRVEEPYVYEKFLFGIQTGEGVLTPNEWWQLHLHPVLDLITGFAYLVFVLVYILVSGYFYFYLSRKGAKKLSAATILKERWQLVWSFFWVNIIGYSTYYWYPAAPPWYVAEKGLGPADLSTPASAAGCVRFDEILGTNFFGEMYGRSADVFGAIPSLHVAYPLLSVLYAFRYGALTGFTLVFYLLMCFAAVYLNHHYIIDLIWGSVYSVIVYVALLWYQRRPTAQK